MIKKTLLTAYILFIIFAGNCQTATEWQSDLRWLQQTVHSKYSNLFYTISSADWDKAVDDFNTALPTLNKFQVLAGFIKLVALFHIGHTQINTFALHGDNAKAMTLHRYPYQLYWFSDGLYIRRADNSYANAVGGKVIKIGNMKAEDALEAARSLVSYENQYGYKSNVMAFLSTPEFLQTQGITNSADEVSITYIKSGKQETTVFAAGNNNNNIFSSTGLVTPQGWVDAKQSGNIPLWQKEPTAYRYMEYLPESKTLYVRHSVTLNDGDKTIEAFFRNMADFIDKNDVQKLILDIRMNGGGNNYINKPIITSIIESKKINQRGKFFVITGRRTFSAAQNLTNELEKYTEVIFVGEPTAENVNFYGDTRTETLPNSKLQANLSWMWWQNLDPRDKRSETSPQMAVDMSFNDYYTNIDPALKAIFNFKNAKPFLSNLTELLNAGKKESALQLALDYKSDPLNRYYATNLEADINREGYDNMESKPILANALLELNLKLFPESANAYDSYAESLLKIGKPADAILNYEMAIIKDKDGQTAENSRKMIEKIKSGGK